MAKNVNNLQEFNDKLGKICCCLKNECDVEIDLEKYDAFIVKRLGSSNTLDDGRKSNQTHIAITGNQMDMFPFLRSPSYFNNPKNNNNLKKFFYLRIPMLLNKSNLTYLNDKCEDIEDSNIKTFTHVVTRDGDNNQLQLSLVNKDDQMFINFRRELHENDYLIFLKNKNSFEYEAYGIRENSSNSILNEFNNKFFYIKNETVISSKKIIIENDNSNNKKVTGGENILVYGVPGVGKSWFVSQKYCTDESCVMRVIFHPDYSYNDFVGQILPKIGDNNEFRYEFIPGPFTSILKEAINNPYNKYFLIIEEINRGNAPAIFGDVFQLLDRKKETDENGLKGASEYGITSPDIAKVVYGDSNHKVKIPSNLSIIGTMNTADQNVFTLDTAFQRRWDMKLIENSFKDVSNDFKHSIILDTEVTWESFCNVINSLILENNSFNISSEDKRMGVYFISKNDLKYEDNQGKFSEKVLKYLWDDAFKFSRETIFNKEFSSLESVISYFNNKTGRKRFEVFNDNVYDKLYDN